MSDPPSKRRKTSPTTAGPVVDAAAVEELNANEHLLRSSVTHRQSFQSPTRSSLARSNPEVLSHAIARSPTRSPQRQSRQQQQTRPSSGSRKSQDRTFGLRDRKALRPSLAANTESPPLQTLSQSPPKRLGSIAIQQQEQAFGAPARRQSKRVGSPISRESETGRGGQTTPVRQNDPDEQLASELNSATRELESSGLLAPSALPDDSLEPELPPTPTELGRRRIKEVSQDLLSSPRPERRIRKDLFGTSTLRSIDVVSNTDAREKEFDDSTIQNRRGLKRELLAQLDQLKADVAKLEKWTNRAECVIDDLPTDQEDVSSLISILAMNRSNDRQLKSSVPEQPPISTLISSLLPFSAKAVPIDTRPASPEPINAFALNNIPDPKPYITAFAPLSLEHSSSLSLSTSGPESGTAITETHDIILSAPFPFPPKQFRVPLRFTTDLQSQRITSVSLSKRLLLSTQAKIPASLQSWIESRISNPVLGLDVLGLCFGINRYWEASMSRARIWSRLRKSQENLRSKDPKKRKLGEIQAESFTGALKTSDVRSIVPYLQCPSMAFSSFPSNSSDNRREAQLLLNCPLTLDQWTSEAQIKPDITISISSLSESKRNRVELELKRLFHSVLKDGARGSMMTGLNEERHAQAIVRAVEGVMGVLFGLDVL